MSFFKELRRRNVIKVAAAYLVVSWLIMQVAEVLIPALHLPDWVLTATLYFLAIGFLPALIGAWAFELTPEGIRREKKVDPEQSITTQTGRKLDFLVIGLLAVGIIYLMIDKFWLEDGVETAATVSPQGEVVEAEEVAPSIAVLPFVNMSADADNEYFSDGVSEEILNVLTGIENLKVTARTSAFSYKGSKLKIDEIARELGVNHILEGSVRKSGDQVRVTAQLIRADGGFHLWSETYDRKLDNIFAIQDEIAGEIAAALQVTLELEPERENFTGTNSSQAYEA
jgi:TolB-like protein